MEVLERICIVPQVTPPPRPRSGDSDNESPNLKQPQVEQPLSYPTPTELTCSFSLSIPLGNTVEWSFWQPEPSQQGVCALADLQTSTPPGGSDAYLVCLLGLFVSCNWASSREFKQENDSSKICASSQKLERFLQLTETSLSRGFGKPRKREFQPSGQDLPSTQGAAEIAE